MYGVGETVPESWWSTSAVATGAVSEPMPSAIAQASVSLRNKRDIDDLVPGGCAAAARKVTGGGAVLSIIIPNLGAGAAREKARRRGMATGSSGRAASGWASPS